MNSETRTTEELKVAHKAYMLRTCSTKMQGAAKRLINGRTVSSEPFLWPTSGTVVAPDWDPRPICGGGLHGLLWGAGDAQLLSWELNAPVLVVGIDEWTEIDDKKIKSPAGEVIYCGDLKGAADLLMALGGDPTTMVGATLTGGYGATLTGGDSATLTGGDRATLTGQWYDEKQKRWRRKLAEVGEDGILPNVPYRLDKGIWVQIQEEKK